MIPDHSATIHFGVICSQYTGRASQKSFCFEFHTPVTIKGGPSGWGLLEGYIRRVAIGVY